MTCTWVPQFGNHQRHIVILLVTLISACATHIPVNEREALRQKIDQTTNKIIATLVNDNPELQQELDASAGYLGASFSGAMVALVGGGYGLGVLVDRNEATRTYVNITGFDVGLGLGKVGASALVLIKDDDTFKRFNEGKWISSMSSIAVSGEASSASTATSAPIKVYPLSESGLGLSASARLIKVSVNEDLTDTGVSDISIPNIGSTGDEPQREDAPRKWKRKLPFLAQNVIDMGYDLPLPYGFSLILVHAEQDMLLGSLEVGLNGSSKQPFEFVAFENAQAINDTLQLKFDAWLFPFMNVFGLIGRVEGDAPMDILLDGNGMLDMLGVSCPSINPLCPVLNDRIITLPIEAPFSGTTYGIGAVLAGGWNDWLVAVPMNFTYANMDTTDTEGIAVTVTPRFGRLFNFDRYGKLALFAGGNYLNAELDVSGRVYLPVPGGDDLQVDYDISQKNKDEWNLILGGNWDISKNWSVMAEYNGFIGSRETFIASLTFRY